MFTQTFEFSQSDLKLRPVDDYALVEEGVYHSASILGEVIVPTPMRYRDLPSTVDTMKKSLVGDPLERYLSDAADGRKDSKLHKAGRNAILFMATAVNIYNKRMWTINHGESIIAIVDSKSAPPPQSKLIDSIFVPLVRAIRDTTESKEQRKRSKEFAETVHAAVESVLGPRISQMIEVGSLATRPDRQGRGYASTLVHLATTLADAQGRECWLASSNTANLAFYNSLGFYTVYSIPIGKDNSTWTEPPVMVDLMVRQPKGRFVLDEKKGPLKEHF